MLDFRSISPSAQFSSLLKTPHVVILSVAPAPTASSPGSLRKDIHGHTGPTESDSGNGPEICFNV